MLTSERHHYHYQNSYQQIARYTNKNILLDRHTQSMPYPKIKCGCLGCGRVFAGKHKGQRALEPAIKHMEKCCPETLAEARRGSPNLFQRCQIGCKYCQVPGYDPASMKEKKRIEQTRNKEAMEKLRRSMSELEEEARITSGYSHTNFGVGAPKHDDIIYGSYYDDHDDYNDTPVDFLRPDGDIEGKDIQWCLDNGFFQVEDGLWSGDWYYDTTHSDERYIHHQKRIKETERIRRNGKQRTKHHKVLEGS